MKELLMNNYIKNQHDLVEELRNHMAENCLPCADQIITDGRIHRYSTDTQRNKRDEWYIAYEGTSLQDRLYLTVIYGSWSTGNQYVFKSYEKYTISDLERQHLQSEFEQKKKEAEQQIKDAQNNAAILATKAWNEALSEPPSQNFLIYPKSKGIEAIGAKFAIKSSRILLPLKNIKGEIRSLQSIYVDEQGKTIKRFLQDGEKGETFIILGDFLMVTLYMLLRAGQPVSVFIQRMLEQLSLLMMLTIYFQ